MAHDTIAQLGEIMQIAFVPQDFDAAIDHWVKKGAGPFYILKGSQVEWQTIYGVDCKPNLDIALGQWGAMQIEIIRQNSSEKTVYSDWFSARQEGVHHTCIVVENIREARKRCAAIGAEFVVEGRALDTYWFFADVGAGPGTYLEVIQYGNASRGLMDMIRDAARNWEGSDPIRALG